MGLELLVPQIDNSLGDAEERKSPFLHNKHIERNFLIFKEISFSKRGVRTQYDDEDEVDKQQIIVGERKVQARI